MASEVFYTGKPCKHGHTSGRYVVGRRCVECLRMYGIAQRKARLNGRVPRFKYDPLNPVDTKLCKICGIEKPRTSFSKHATAKNGVIPYCKKCATAMATERRKTNPTKSAHIYRKYNLKRKYGLTPDEYDDLLKKQNGCCALCGTDSPGGRGNFAVDHDHITNTVRSLLCNMCNIGLGHFNDSPELLKRAADYILNGGYRVK